MPVFELPPVGKGSVSIATPSRAQPGYSCISVAPKIFLHPSAHLGTPFLKGTRLLQKVFLTPECFTTS